MPPADRQRRPIRTPDQRLRAFVSSTLGELAAERRAAREAIERLHISPVMFELGARPHPPRQLYRAYVEQSDVFIGIYWQSYGWVAPDEDVSGLEDELRLAAEMPRLIYIKEPAPDREQRLAELLRRIRDDDRASYKRFADDAELRELLANDLAVMLAERFDAGARADDAAAAAASAPPAPLTATYGRAGDVEEVRAALAAGARLLTLTGPGGVGKTRVALEVARGAGDLYRDGVHFVPLGEITSPPLVAHAIADRLGIPSEGSLGAVELLADRLREERALLVLDNLEQVAECVADLTALLERCPELAILATSRRPLRARAERELAIAPLPTPDPEAGGAALLEQPAVRLFADRAGAASAGFELDDENAAAVAELCGRLDGLPLAIELAAARVRLLPPAALLDRLANHLDALGEGGPDLPARQRTLRATVEWSHELLGERERALFARLGIFAGGFSLEAVEAICDPGDPDVIEGLASLLDESLVVGAEGGDAEPRFRMLETVRRYARERLEERGEEAEIARRHLEWYRELSDRAQPFLCGPRQREWAERFDPERANLRVAVDTALALDEDETVIELAWDVIVFYFIRDAVHEPAGWLERVADAGRPLPELSRAKLVSLRALIGIRGGEYEGAGEALESSLEAFLGRGMDFEAAVTLKELAWVRYLLDEDAERAVAALEEASRLFDRVEHDWGVALTELQLGSVHSAAGRLAAAEDRYRISLERSRRIENEPLIGAALEHLALVRVIDGRDAEAIDLLAQAREPLRRGRHQTEATVCLDALAAIALRTADPASAARAHAVAEAVRDRLGISPWPSMQPFLARLAGEIRSALDGRELSAIDVEAADADPFLAVDVALESVRAGRAPAAGAGRG